MVFMYSCFGAWGKLANFDPSQNFDLSIPYDRAFQKLQNATFNFEIDRVLAVMTFDS